MKTLRKLALKYPEAEEGIACKGTAIECTTFKARGKAFLFLARTNLRLKLGESLAEATALAAKEPGRYEVGAHGWIKVTLGDDRLPMELLTRWIDESYRLLAPKQFVAMLAERGGRR
jgi:predicted DNA-binding protein (MmcQ/YjbR family)